MSQGNTTTLINEILIDAPPQAVFDYVSRPDLWHEWHPASTSAELPRVPLKVGLVCRDVQRQQASMTLLRNLLEEVMSATDDRSINPDGLSG